MRKLLLTWPIMEAVIFIQQDMEFKDVKWQDVFRAIREELTTSRGQGVMAESYIQETFGGDIGTLYKKYPLTSEAENPEVRKTEQKANVVMRAAGIVWKTSQWVIGYPGMDSSKRANRYRLALIMFANVIKAVAKDLPVNDFHTCPMPKLRPRKELGEGFMERYNRVWWLI
jgi:hypothetical protein